jgi:8-hydroxy-5-deazaflavin:NADPH oxidoreductase
MKIGIIGSGDVGRILGKAFASEGHQVMLGTRDIKKEAVVKWLAENKRTQAGSFTDAAKFGEIILLATAGDITEKVIESAGINNFDNKVVIDATNPIDHTKAPVNGVLQYFTAAEESLMEKLQKILPKANVVKAFNSVGSGLMYKPDFGITKPTMFICGNDDTAKKTVTEILDVFGWETEDMGKANAAGAIEALCILWCLPGFIKNDWVHAFKLLKK